MGCITTLDDFTALASAIDALPADCDPAERMDAAEDVFRACRASRVTVSEGLELLWRIVKGGRE